MAFMSLLQSFFSGKPSISISLTAATNGNKPVVISKKKSIWKLIKMAWFMLIFTGEFILKCSCVKDKKTVVTGGDGVQLWPRKLVTASFTLEDMNIVKKSVVPNATINDVMLGVLSSGISEYINLHTSNGTRKDQKITALILVNLRPFTGIPELQDLMKADPKSGWGNKISFILHPMSLHKLKESDPLHQLKEAKLSMDKKKLSKVARFSYILVKLTMTVFGPRFATLMLSRMTCNTTLAFSNIVGPSQEVTMVGKPVISIKMSISSLPHFLNRL
ncbi:hypothetical protein QQ045_030468 [Rhodiola kirilowii]